MKKQIIWSLKKSHGSYLKTTKNIKYLNMHGGFGSDVLGANNKFLKKKMKKLPIEYIINKPANEDFPIKKFLKFQKKFRSLIPKNYPHLFFIDGGALAVENALKIAMDYKYQKLNLNQSNAKKLQILHFDKCFHGRSGYTLSLTNTDPIKTNNFEKFNWPRFKPKEENLKDIDTFCKNNKYVAAIIIEPIQCEGGDIHISSKFLKGLENICNIYDIIFIVDEVQTGFFTTGKTWCFQHHDICPDIVVFGKKSQQCGLFCGTKINSIKNNCFVETNKLGSTWNGNLLDMIRSTYIIDIIKKNKLDENARIMGDYWKDLMNQEGNFFNRSKSVSNIRNKGFIMSFDMCNQEERDKLIKDLFNYERLIVLKCGKKTIRLRPNLCVKEKIIETSVKKIYRSIDRINGYRKYI